MIILNENNVINIDYLKGIKLKPSEGLIKFYFSDRTAKTVMDDFRMSKVLDMIIEYGFIQIDDNYINPYLVKGFENLRDGRVKFYFPDTTALTLYLDDDAFEDLVAYFTKTEE